MTWAGHELNNHHRARINTNQKGHTKFRLQLRAKLGSKARPNMIYIKDAAGK